MANQLAQALRPASRIDAAYPTWASAFLLLVWLAAGAVAFLPFALNTSPWDAVLFHVPGNQGNWWHFLAGAPCFLAFPMIWMRLRALFSNQSSTRTGRRILWCIIALSIVGTILVEMPFLLHLAGTSQWQQFLVLGLGFGIIFASVIIQALRRRQIPAAEACIAGLDTAYLANLSLILVVYAGEAGPVSSRSGWFVAIVIAWPILIELVWLLARSWATGEPASLRNT
jgi:hypothetical protein